VYLSDKEIKPLVTSPELRFNDRQYKNLITQLEKAGLIKTSRGKEVSPEAELLRRERQDFARWLSDNWASVHGLAMNVIRRWEPYALTMGYQETTPAGEIRARMGEFIFDAVEFYLRTGADARVLVAENRALWASLEAFKVAIDRLMATIKKLYLYCLLASMAEPDNPHLQALLRIIRGDIYGGGAEKGGEKAAVA